MMCLTGRLLILLFCTTAAAAQSFTPGEVVVAGTRTSEGREIVSVFSPDGTSSRTLGVPNIFAHEAAFNRAGELVLVLSGSVWVYGPEGLFRRALPTEGLLLFVRAMAFAADGRTLLSWSPARLVILSPSDQRLAGYDLPGATLSLDLASDQCTLYVNTIATIEYGASVLRYNLCAGDALTPTVLRSYTNPGTRPEEVRILPNGELLVATRAGVERLSAAGTLLQSYNVPAVQLALAPDARSFYAAGGTAPVRRVDLATGAVLQTITTGLNVHAIAVAGDPRAAFATAADVPLLTPAALLLFALLAAVTGVVVLAR